ncbi:MAG: DUF3160 domain-containing protein [Ignavibacteria bacterium]|nr:DUF3160 domain-containing protein [Ignavibacteria bacterium]MCU7502435.1 DUF3160 domain-containing protein [Ignavibacteria bacterium]MCU7515000.1 DUF3160 domain-containing protein [Ignavibacteria bacterium]
MKHFLWSLSILFIFSGFFPALHPQTSDFSISNYKAFLSNNQNLTTEKLLGLHPAGNFMGNLRLNALNSPSAKLIDEKFSLTPGEKSLLNKNGFMVTERMSYPTFQSAFMDIYNKDIPVMVTSDAILHAFHISYDNILIDMEQEVLIPELKNFLSRLHEKLPLLASAYASDAKMATSLKDVDIYLTVARTLLGDQAAAFFAENSGEISEILQMVASEQPAGIKLFSSTERTVDFSQFKPRGHYTLSSSLSSYFKSMIWLGRTEIYLLAPRADQPLPTSEDIQRQTIDAGLILEAVEASGSLPQYEKINGIIEFFTGKQDNVTLTDLKDLTKSLNITKANEFLDLSRLKTFQDSLKSQAYAFQKILSQILMTGFDSPDSIMPASAFLLLGQRFVVDSYVTSQIVFDKITFNNSTVKRMLPSTLDIIYALGNDAAAQLLQPELDAFHYGTNLAALRYLIDSYGPDFWDLSLYNGWLDAIRQLNPKSDRSKLPLFMKTAAWWQQKLNTQLASWAQLRHDNLLYAKQSYSGGVGCSFPYAYVEPVPELFLRLKKLSEKAKDYFSGFSFSSSYEKDKLMDYFTNAISVYTILSSMADKELNNTAVSLEELGFISSMFSTGNPCGSMGNFSLGWYPKLFYKNEDYNPGKMESVVADVHTAPTDEAGNPVGWVLHAGTGLVNLGIFSIVTPTIEKPSGDTITFAGPLMSYFEHRTTNFQRLSDEEWTNMISGNEKVFPEHPEFVNLYMADKSGSERQAGLSLLTSVLDRQDNVLPKTTLIAKNFPNPFNSSTIISFVIPNAMANRQVTLKIYSALGTEVKKLLDNTLPAGSYLTRWDGTDNFGQNVSSGIYFYNLILDSGGLKEKVSGKMILMK